jgi:hypothetical protein
MAASALVIAGCGNDPHASITASASQQLVAVVARVRVAAAAGDITTARARLADIRTRVIALQRRGEISESTATRIVLATDAVDADLRLAPTTTTPPPPTTPPEKHHGKGHGDGGD